ncbi:MAG: DUF2791 family P-loop domain-containing protein [Planctomycetales bacterium]|nr:DUF2791 family P-loop domain-containing protein [Planctomycetales bacterium]
MEQDPQSESRLVAKDIIESLRASGQPPKLGARSINVGTDKLLQKINEFLDDQCVRHDDRDGRGGCRWIEGDYGNGKTQFLRCVRESAWERGFVVAFVELDHKTSPLNDMRKVFAAVAKAMQAPPSSSAEVDRDKGFDTVLTSLLDKKFPGLLTGMPDEGLKKEALDWINQSFRRTSVEIKPIAHAAAKFLRAVIEGDSETEDLTREFLRGGDVPPARLNKIDIFFKFDASKALDALKSVTQLLQRSGLATGTILLFDEARRTLSLMSTRGKKEACENLLTIINSCNEAAFPGTMFLYAVMPEFFTDFATQYPALQQRCGDATRIKINRFEGQPEPEVLAAIADKIRHVYWTAYELASVSDGQQAALANAFSQLAQSALRDSMGAGTRRLLVRTTVEYLDRFREDGKLADLSAAAADSMSKQCGEELDTAAVKFQSSDGE